MPSRSPPPLLRRAVHMKPPTPHTHDPPHVPIIFSHLSRIETRQAAWLFHYYLGSGRRGDRIRKIMAGGVAAGQNAHMEMVLKAEDEAMEMEMVASAAEAVGERNRGHGDGEAVASGGVQEVCVCVFPLQVRFARNVLSLPCCVRTGLGEGRDWLNERSATPPPPACALLSPKSRFVKDCLCVLVLPRSLISLTWYLFWW